MLSFFGVVYESPVLFTDFNACNCNEALLPSVCRISGAKACLSGPRVTDQPSPARWWNQRERYIEIHRTCTVDKLFLGPRRSGRTNAGKDSKIKQKIVEDFLLSCYVLLAVVASGGL